MKTKQNKKNILLKALTLLAFSLPFVGCQQKGPAEKAGERLDDAIDNVKHGDSPLKEKGTMEKFGETLDDASKKDDKNKKIGGK